MGYHATVANHCFQETVANLFFDTETDCCQPILSAGSISG
jgi:hypothetical protein